MRSIEDIEELAKSLALDEDELAPFMAITRREQRKARLVKSKAPLNDDERALLSEDRPLEPRAALMQTRAWLDEATRRGQPGPSALALCGPEGSGRHLAACWVLAREGGRYRDAHTMVRRYVRATSSRARLDERRELDIWADARVLVVAEVGAEPITEPERLAFSRLVEARPKKLTILITALSRELLLDRAAVGWDAKTNEWFRREARIVSVGGDS